MRIYLKNGMIIDDVNEQIVNEIAIKISSPEGARSWQIFNNVAKNNKIILIINLNEVSFIK